ncbi:hypothetical protein TNCV_3282291 [Trichonephila clavipes]|nr:hypothetical protein TNCV_3282291 [Trichonephila clavipes]
MKSKPKPTLRRLRISLELIGYLSTTEKIPHHRIRTHYEQLLEFERGRITGLKEAIWINRKIPPHVGRRMVPLTI